MKIKRYSYMLFILLICILSISAVSAADDAATDTIGTNIDDTIIDSADDAVSNAISTNIDDTIIDSADKEISLDENKLESTEESKLSESPQNFTALNQKINENEDETIELDCDYAYNSTTDKPYRYGIIINRTLTIDGKNHTINGSNQARIFQVSHDDVTIKNINFVNGFTDSRGGAIYWTGNNGTLTNNTFTQNTAVGSNLAGLGGAIHWHGHNGTLTNNTFTQNTATERGGAIHWTGQNSKFTQNTFTQNNATDSEGKGGAIYWISDHGTLTNNTFTQNNAAYNGGAIYSNSDYGTITQNTFTENNATENGGAIFLSGPYGTITQNTFTQNTANKYGGAILWYGNYGNLTGNLFINNTANKSGSAYYNSYDVGSNSKINNNTFLNNTGGNIIQFEYPEGSDIDYNWFGNTADNYTAAPNTQTPNVWLFLNATANPELIPVSDIAEIIFNLYTYNGEQIAEYDTSNMPIVNLSLSSTKGNANSSALIGETITYTPNSIGIGTVTAKTENIEYAIDIKITDGASFTDLNIVINKDPNADEINLTQDYKYNPEVDTEFIDGIKITRKITIDGQNHTINGSNQARIFQINHDDVTIKNINFANGNTTASGGAIKWLGNNGTLNNNTFTQNNANNEGGAIQWTGNQGILTNNTFTQNNASLFGGAINWNGHNGTLNNNTFTQNNASQSGGAIYWQGNNGTLTQNTFTQNKANYGGAIFLRGNNGNLTQNTFTENNANRDGGAISWRGDNGNINNNNFTQNKATNSGGAIYWDSQYGTLTGNLFINSSASSGNAYFNHNDEVSNIKINNNTFLNYRGGFEIFFSNPEGSNIDYNWFGNTADNYTVAPNAQRTPNVWLFLNATANPELIPVSDIAEIIFNLYTYNGEQIAEYDTSNMPIVNLSLSSTKGNANSSALIGETITYTANSIGTGTVTAKTENIEYAIDIKITDGSSFTDLNHLINKDPNADEINLTQNYKYNQEIDTEFIDGIIINRTLTIDGQNHTINGSDLARIFNVTASEVTIMNIIFANGNTTGSGGAIYWSGDNGVLSNSNFTQNQATGDFACGGAIYWSGDNGILNNSNFTQNQATGDFACGGAINWSGDNGNIANSNFTQNNATYYGGAINWLGNNGNIANSNFTQNTANHTGGAINWNGTNGTLNNNTFTQNTATKHGGAINWWADYGTINNSNFTENQANISGGAINWLANNGTLNNNTFTQNQAMGDGGAIGWGGANGTLNNNTFTQNTANDGGAISWCQYGSFYVNSDNGTLNNNTFTQNTATNGGAIKWQGNYGTLNNNTFTQNQATRDYGIGGAISWQGNYGTLNNNTFTQNTATNGYTYYNEKYGNSNTKINNNIFLNNTGRSEIYFNTPEGSNTDYNWFGNTADNYTTAPNVQVETLTTWLFLNATAEPSTIEIFNSSEISFKLQAYNASNDNVSEYDNTMLPSVNLTMSATKGTINDYMALGSSLEYIATELGTASVTATIENIGYTIQLTNTKGNPNLSVSSEESNYGENATIQLSYNAEATGTVNITLKGKKGQSYKFENINLNNTVTLPANILPDEYNITVEYSGDYNFSDANASGNLIVNKIDIDINATASDITYGEEATVNVDINATGTLTLNIDGKNYTAEINDGKATIKVPNLSAGTKNAMIYYSGDEIYNKNQKAISFTVNKANAKLTASAVTTTYNVKKNLVITLKDSKGKAISGVKITVNLGKNKQYTTDKNGQVKVAVGSLTPKTYTAKISFAGNNKYKASSNTAKVVVKKAKPKITAKAKTFKSKSRKYKIKLKNNKGKAIKKAKVSLKVAKKTYKAKTNSKGVATFKLKKLAKKGKYTAVIKYAGNKYYKKASKKAKLKVKKALWTTVSKGSKDKATIKKIQRALKKNGYYLSYKGHYLKVDGKFNSCTVRSVKQFQKAKKLKVTGKVDVKTAKKLKIYK